MGKSWQSIVWTLSVLLFVAGAAASCSQPQPKSRINSNVPGEKAALPPTPDSSVRMKEAGGAKSWRTTADAIIAEGVKYMGTPYVYGAERFEDKAFDCSSYVQYLYGHHGVSLGYNAREQAVQGKDTTFMNMRRGDLMFFSDEDFPNETGLNKVRHVGIYMGEGKILHTYQPGIGVVISNIHKDEKEGEYWFQHFLLARRVIPD
ncbi:C40 family peptidase [Paenibacillus tyrfis]|uniref:C40 family peptidase n=1 Tax=Paenibacillus tyrfis TaxID=1501230 RepID=UPI000690F2C9|nr:C40 family peptidase [Paenibacillus tyrfis]